MPNEDEARPPEGSGSRPVAATRIPPVISKFRLIIKLGLVLVLLASPARALQQAQQPALAGSSIQTEYQLIAHAGGQARLPCLIGKQANCGDPYFIAWYKLNATSRQWTRIEAKSLSGASDNENQAIEQQQEEADHERLRSGVASSRPLAERVHFVWSRSSPSMSSLSNCFLSGDGSSNQTLDQGLLTWARRQQHQKAGQKLSALMAAGQLFDCGQLSVSSLELQDEAQYKCEITFSDSLDFDKCPASTSTQLNVIARPNEPEILLNGRPTAGNGLATFKEGAQVRLECQSAGGKPAPRIEWLNLTSWSAHADNQRPKFIRGHDNDDQSMNMNYDQLQGTGPQAAASSQPPELVQLMRLYWPIKRATYSVNSYAELAGNNGQSPMAGNNINQPAPGQQQIPITSSSITITLSRFDLRSRFVCLVLPPTYNSIAAAGATSRPTSAGPASNHELPASVRNAREFARLIDQVPMLAGSRLDPPHGPLLKWIKLDVLAKPTSVSVRLLDLGASSPVQLGQEQAASVQQAAGLAAHYSLRPNRLYAIQCLVEDSRPRSQVAWFNRTAPIELEGAELEASDFVLPNKQQAHRLTSFVRHIEQQSGTFRTISTLLLTTNYYDNSDELICRISNEAFPFDELAQVAPIQSARLQVNYPPSAWLEAQDAKWEGSNKLSPPVLGPTGRPIGQLSGELGQRLQMRCFVGANPLHHGAIVQIEWFKDGQRLVSSHANATARPAASTRPTNGSSLLIEKAYHLHMPQLQPPQQLVELQAPSEQPAARLLTHSTLTIGSLAKSDAGHYDCQFKLIQAPTTQQQQVGSHWASASSLANLNALQLQLQQASGQLRANTPVWADQTLSLTVIEAKLPAIRISSTSGLFVYDKTATATATTTTTTTQIQARSHLQRQRLEVVVADPRASELSLSCHYNSERGRRQQAPAMELGHKVLWYLNGALRHSSSLDLLALRLKDAPADQSLDSAGQLMLELIAGNGGRLSCAHQMLESSALLASPTNFHSQSMRVFPSSNEIDLRFRVEPKVLIASTRHQESLLMPPVRTFSELELIAQPLNKLRLACLAQCEPLCSIEWLLNKRPILETDSSQTELEAQRESQLVQAHEIADNQTRIFKSARRLQDSTQLGLSSLMLQVENQIHRRTSSGSERFPWYRQTSLGPGTLVNATQFELASRQLMRDSYELIQVLGDQALGTNVFSKLELSYNQISQLMAPLNGQPNLAPTAGNANQPEGDKELLIECRVGELMSGGQTQQQEQFGHAHVMPNVFHPALSSAGSQRNETSAGRDHDTRDSLSEQQDEQQSEPLASPLELGPVNLTSLFGSSSAHQQRASRLQTRVLLESQTRTRATLAPPLDSQTMSLGNQPAGVPASNNLPPMVLSPQFTTNNSLNFEGQLSKFSTSGQQQPFQTQPTSISPVVRNWLLGHLDLILVGACSLALVWLAALLVGPLLRRRLLARSPFAKSAGHQHKANWRLNSSRASSTNEIGLFGNGSASSSAHKFGQLSAANNYYGPPDSNGADSSEQDMVQSSSQSSHYEDFIQHQLQQRLVAHHHQQQQQQHHQALYFNQAQLVESTTLSRGPLVSGAEIKQRQGGAAAHLYGDPQSIVAAARQQQQQQQQFASTMRHNPSSVPLISGTSSRINLNDLQQRSSRNSSGLYSNRFAAAQQHAHTFGKALLAAQAPPVPIREAAQLQEHIYDDVN